MPGGRIPIGEQADLEDRGYASARPAGARGDQPLLVQQLRAGRAARAVHGEPDLIVSAASGLVLLVGLLVIYVPVVRNPAFALILLVASVARPRPGPAELAVHSSRRDGFRIVAAGSGALSRRGPPAVAMPRREAPRLALEEESVHAPPPELDSDVQRLTATEVDADGAASRDG